MKAIPEGTMLHLGGLDAKEAQALLDEMLARHEIEDRRGGAPANVEGPWKQLAVWGSHPMGITHAGRAYVLREWVDTNQHPAALMMEWVELPNPGEKKANVIP